MARAQGSHPSALEAYRGAQGGDDNAVPPTGKGGTFHAAFERARERLGSPMPRDATLQAMREYLSSKR